MVDRQDAGHFAGIAEDLISAKSAIKRAKKEVDQELRFSRQAFADKFALFDWQKMPLLLHWMARSLELAAEGE